MPFKLAVCRIEGFDSPPPDAQSVQRTPTDFSHPNLVAAARAAAAPPAISKKGPEATEPQTALKLGLQLIERDAKLAIAKTASEAAQAEAIVEQALYGALSPFWAQCLVAFVEHYLLTKHTSVPYIKYTTLNDFVIPNGLKENCKIAIIGDWGTGEPRAQALLDEIAANGSRHSYPPRRHILFLHRF